MTWAAALKLGPWIAIALLLAALGVTRGTLARVRLQAQLDVSAAQLASTKHDAAEAARTTAAVTAFAERTAALQPIIVRSTNEVTRYAETPAGRVSCLAPDRVHAIDVLDASLFSQASAGGGAGAMRTDARTAAGGRISDQR